jgi:tetratricopeptide (TPR) repeat protein
MRYVSTIALGAALALGAVTVAGVEPAMAQKKEKAAKAPDFKLSKTVREAVVAAQAASKAGDAATAQAKLAEAQTAATTDDERYVVGSVLLDVARAKNDTKLQGDAIEMMLASNKVPAENAGTYNLVAGQIAYQNKDMVKADKYLTQAVATNVSDVNAYAMLAETKNQLGRPAEAISVLESAIAKQKAAGQTVPNEWYARGISIGYNAKLAPQLEQLTQEWLVAYPTPSNWRDSLITYRDLNKPDADYELDLMRLMRAAGALKGERDYMDYVQATYLKFPTEANGVLDEGVAKGDIKLTGNANEIKTLVKGKLAGDKTATQSAANDVKAGKASGKLALGTGDALYGAGDFTQAAEVYKAALAKGDVDKNVANIRLGAALARAGQKDAAKQALSQVTGPRASLAKYWMVWIDQKAA